MLHMYVLQMTDLTTFLVTITIFRADSKVFLLVVVRCIFYFILGQCQIVQKYKPFKINKRSL